MPGVRYGPDIADDAAFVLNLLRDQQRRIARGLKPEDQRQYDKARTLANKVFGVSLRDVDRGRFGALQQLAQYSISGRDARGRAYKRSKLERSWRTGRLMKRGIAQEFEKRAGGDKKAGRQTVGSVGTGPLAEVPGGAMYIGRTKTKKFDELANAAYARAKRNKITKTADAAAIDKLNIARAGRYTPGLETQPYGGSTPRGGTIRPPMRKAARDTARKRGQAAARKAAQDAAGEASKGKASVARPRKKKS